MRITTRRLSQVASRIAGVDVGVEFGHELPLDVDGCALHDGRRYVIKIAPRLFEWEDVARVSATFWHELHHVIRGDAKPRGVLTRMVTAADLQAGRLWGLGAGKAREDACDAFAARMRREIPDRDLWALVVD